MLQFLDFKAIGFGVLTNLALSLILGLFATIVAMMVFSIQGLSVEAMDAALARPWESLPFYLFLVAIGAACDYGAGIVTARVAARLEYYQTFAMMTLMVLISILMGRGDMPITFFLLSVVVGAAAAFYATFRVKSRKQSDGVA